MLVLRGEQGLESVGLLRRSPWPVDVAAVLDGEDDDLSWVLADPIEHAVGAAPS
jgi:hypothetical protein